MRQERKDWGERFFSLFGNMSKIAKKPVILKEGVNVNIKGIMLKSADQKANCRL